MLSWIFLHSFLNCYYSQRNFLETERGNILPGNLCIMKANVRHQQKAIFSIKKYLTIQSMTSSCSENSKHPWWSHFNIEFSWQYNFSGKTVFLIVSHFSATIKRVVYFKWKLTLSKANEYLSMSFGRPQRRDLFFVPLVWSSFWHVPAFSSLLWLVPGSSTFYKWRCHRMFWLAILL